MSNERESRGQETRAGEKNSRMDESRRLEMREKELMPLYTMDYRSPLYIDPSLIPPGWTYSWGRKSIYNEEDIGNQTKLYNQGWTPVPADRHPQLRSTPLFGNQTVKGYIEYKGLVLMERPASLTKRDNEIIANHNRQVMTSMPGTEQFMGETGIPSRFIQNDLSYGRKSDFQG